MGLLVEQDHRVAADDGLEDPRALARVHGVRRRGEQLLDVCWVRKDDERWLEWQPDRHALAVAAQAPQRRRRAGPGPEQLDRGGRARSGGQCFSELSVHAALLRSRDCRDTKLSTPRVWRV